MGEKLLNIRAVERLQGYRIGLHYGSTENI